MTTELAKNTVSALLIEPQERQTACQLLADLDGVLMKTPLGQTPNFGKPPEKLRANLLTLQRMLLPGSPDSIAEVIERMLAHYPRKDEVPDSLVEDWVRMLMPYPLLSIWECYEKQIQKADKWGPSLGQFMQAVDRHSNNIKQTARQLAAALPAGKEAG